MFYRMMNGLLMLDHGNLGLIMMRKLHIHIHILLILITAVGWWLRSAPANCNVYNMGGFNTITMTFYHVFPSGTTNAEYAHHNSWMNINLGGSLLVKKLI